jgi:capsular polysaccharide transport system permease protein
MLPKAAKTLQGLQKQFSILRALMIRDMMMRFGRDNIGFAWVILEPMILCSGVMVIWTVMYGEEEHGTRLIEVVITGYMPLTLWRHMTSAPVLIFRRSSSLLYHRSISLLDILLARQALEFIATTAAAITVWSLLAMAGLVDIPARFDLLIGGWMMMALLALGTGAQIAVGTERWEAGERLIQPIQYLLVPLSGAFFLLDWLPEAARPVLMLNPLINVYEMFRAGFWGAAVPTYYSIWYPLLWAIASIFFGVIAVSRTREHVQLT